jgi:hypothetical protein
MSPNEGQTNAGAMPAALQKAKKAYEELCEDSDYEDFLKRAPCDQEKFTLEQLADRTKLEPEMISTVSQFRAREKDIENSFASAVDSTGGKKPGKLSKVMRETSKKVGDLYLKLVEQKISFGEFNKRLRDVRGNLRAELAKL